MCTKERGGGAGGYLQNTKATVYYGGRLCDLVYHASESYIPSLWTITALLRQLDAE